MGSKKNILIEKVEITDIGSRGKAIARVDNYVTFVSNALPGDVVDVQVRKRKKAYQEGKAVYYHKRSELRVEPFCIHFGYCGGCRWQDLQYEAQLTYKQKEVVDNLKRIGKLNFPDVLTILASEKQKYYRNKLEFTFSNRRWLSQQEIDSKKVIGGRNGLGFHIPGMFDKIIDLEECHLQKEPSNEIRNSVKEFARSHNLSFFDLRKREGLLRNLIIRNTGEGEFMVLMVFFQEDNKSIKALLDYLTEKFPEINSLMYCINRKANDSIFDQEFILHSGKDHIIETMNGLKLKIGPKSFFQTNTSQAFRMYKKIHEFAGLTGHETVYDLYSGTGAIGLFLAENAKKIVGIENIEDSVHDARMNAELNGVKNARFFHGDIKNIITPGFIEKEGSPDIIILDPPRAGMHKDVVKILLSLRPHRIVYVSCNPATQARDLELLCEKFKILAVQPVDMFPHTYHVENIVLLG